MIPDSIISLVGMVTASKTGTEALAGTGKAILETSPPELKKLNTFYSSLSIM